MADPVQSMTPRGVLHIPHSSATIPSDLRSYLVLSDDLSFPKNRNAYLKGKTNRH